VLFVRALPSRAKQATPRKYSARSQEVTLNMATNQAKVEPQQVTSARRIDEVVVNKVAAGKHPR